MHPGKRRLLRYLLWILTTLAFSLSAGPSLSTAPMPQQAASCQTALVIPKSTEPNIFTPQQEVELGEIFAAFVDPNIHPIDDDALAAHLRAIAD